MGSPMMHMAAATGLSIMDLHDVRIRIGEYRLVNKFVRPMEVANMIGNNFVRQVLHSAAVLHEWLQARK
jgi:hypothetical protein